MRVRLLATTLLLLAAGASAARAEPGEDVRAAIDKLAQARSFAWTATYQHRSGSEAEEGVEEKGGYAVSSKTFDLTSGASHIELVRQGSKAVVNFGQGWQTFDEAVNAAGGGPRGRARATLVEMMRNDKPFATFARELLDHTKDLRKVGDAYEGTMSEAGAKAMLEAASSRVRVNRVRGSARFGVKDGVLSAVAFRLEASLNLDGREHAVNSTAAAEVKDVGTAKARVPDEARQKLAAQQDLPF